MASSKCPYGLDRLNNRPGQALPRFAGYPEDRYTVEPAAEALMGSALLVGPQPKPVRQSERVGDCCHKGTWKDQLGLSQISLPTHPWPLLTVTWKGLLGTCSPPKRTQMTYLPGWGAV